MDIKDGDIKSILNTLVVLREEMLEKYKLTPQILEKFRAIDDGIAVIKTKLDDEIFRLKP